MIKEYIDLKRKMAIPMTRSYNLQMPALRLNQIENNA